MLAGNGLFCVPITTCNMYLLTSYVEWSLLKPISRSSRTPLFLDEILYCLQTTRPDGVCEINVQTITETTTSTKTPYRMCMYMSPGLN